ncbi:hypothetical protein ACTA71_000436 [Dictyostelium dimigraforme]
MELKKLDFKQLLVNDKDEIEKYYSCTVCFELIYGKKMLSCINGCCFCEECWTKSISSGYLYCLTSLDMKEVDKKFGCKEIMKIENWENHKEICSSRFKKCENDRCKEITRINLLKEHKENCKYSIVKCQHCLNLFAKLEIENHYNQCPYFIVECPQNCSSTNLFRKQLSDHIKYQCLNTIVECKYKNDGVGCSQTFKRMNESAHYKEINHTSQMEKLIEKQSNQLILLNEILKNLKVNKIYFGSWKIFNFPHYLLKTNLGLNQTIDSPVIEIGPFKIVASIYLNKFRDSIVLNYEDKTNLFKNDYKLYFIMELKPNIQMEIKKIQIPDYNNSTNLILKFEIILILNC